MAPLFSVALAAVLLDLAACRRIREASKESVAIVMPELATVSLLHPFFVHSKALTYTSHLLMSDFTHMMHDTRPWEAAYRHKHKHLPVHDTLLKAVGPKRLDMAELVFDDLGSLFRCVRPEVNIVFIGWHTFDKALRVLKLLSMSEMEKVHHVVQSTAEVDALQQIRDVVSEAQIRTDAACVRAEKVRSDIVERLDAGIEEGVARIMESAQYIDRLSDEQIRSLTVERGAECAGSVFQCSSAAPAACFSSCMELERCAGASVHEGGNASQRCCLTDGAAFVQEPGAMCFNAELLDVARTDMVPYLAAEGLRPNLERKIDLRVPDVQEHVTAPRLSGLGLWLILGSDVATRRALVPAMADAKEHPALVGEAMRREVRTAKRLAEAAAQAVSGYQTPKVMTNMVYTVRGFVGYDSNLATVGWACEVVGKFLGVGGGKLRLLQAITECSADMVHMAMWVRTLYCTCHMLTGGVDDITPIAHAYAAHALLALVVYSSKYAEMLEGIRNKTFAVEREVEEQLSNIATDVTEVFTGTANEDDSGDPDDKTKGFQLQC